MSGSHRSHRAMPARRKKTSGGPAVLVGVSLAVVAVTGAAFLLLRPDGSAAEGGPGSTGNAAVTGLPTVPKPKTGTPLNVTNSEDVAYSLAAAEAGIDDEGHAYIDYVITNKSEETAPYEAPAQLFLPEGDAGTDRCADQEGTDPGLCSPPTTNVITGLLDPAKPPTTEAGDTYMPPGAAFLVRTTTKEPVAETASPEDLRLYIWNVRFIPSRIAREIPLP
ncbi:hypothetical protein LO762_30930 [Actinocorallia sp. API 0066]|uniref:hypothetical protein n=1 Tax=Actinocorallia sp. API 0066 TaxID=2896846 RepID=UPI001E51E1E3|nr:hypothetical protein [Actinocorallia sp. API 0066]MCD0453566.1 hypothetical protein [Actinocorallia sp. API 0066]